jgi:hypothetical protein
MSTNDMVKRELGAIGIDDLVVQEVSIPKVASGSGKFYINDGDESFSCKWVEVGDKVKVTIIKEM